MPAWDPEANDLFLRAREITAAEDRQRFLDEASAGKPELRARAEGLLRAGAEAGSFLERPAEELGATGTLAPGSQDERSPAPQEGPGTVIGPYKLLELIGEGGMGTVWMADQAEPIRRRVALKVVKEGMDSKQVLARFEAERQALALMDHPNIAKVLDAGRTSSGRPYFVMELVKGKPITASCDEKRLGVRERLELFGAVCRAVQHAHQKGIIHRDLKPSNVLVAPYDGKPVVKVIDFGVAKATGQRLTDKTLFTGFGALVGTPEYMSPEQAEVNNQDIDTRSDVYSLGVLLYELLTGSTPLTRKRLKEAALLEVLRVIREEEPPRPSTRLSTAEGLPTLAANRGTEPAKLTRLVRGELDWIVMKALEKDRNRRYETANGFAADVQRCLHDEPVEACPPSASYRIVKFVRRNRGPVLAAGVFVLLLAAGIAGTTIGLIRALAAEQATSEALILARAEQERTQRALAQVTAEQAKTQAALTAESAAKARTREAMNVLTAGVLDTMFAKQPELGPAEKSYLEKVLEFYDTFTEESGHTAEARYLQAAAYFQVAHLRTLLGRPREAEAGYRRAETLLRRLADESKGAPEYIDKLARTRHNLGLNLAELGEEAEAETALKDAVDLQKKLFDDGGGVRYRSELATNYNDLAGLLRLRKQYSDAEKLFRRALDLMENPAPAADAALDRQLLARIRSGLGRVLGDQRKFAEAQDAYREALKGLERTLADYPASPLVRRQLAEAYQGLGVVFAESGKEEDAATVLQQSIDLRKKLSEDYPNVHKYRQALVGSYLDLAVLQARRRRLGDEETACRQAVEQAERLVKVADSVPRDRHALAACLALLGDALAGQQKVADAIEAYSRALPHQMKLVDDFPRVVDYRHELVNTLVKRARLHMQRKEFAEAVPLLEQARPHLEAALEGAPKDPTTRRKWRDRLRLVAEANLALADHARLAATADELARFGYDPANDAFDAAILLCGCAAKAVKDDTLTETRREELIESYAKQALAMLRLAVENGFKDVARLKQDPRLALLRAREGFKKLLAELEGKAKE
jgi:serine/threonine protein kinase/tetratricopeptide (TPR) repeat protein